MSSPSIRLFALLLAVPLAGCSLLLDSDDFEDKKGEPDDGATADDGGDGDGGGDDEDGGDDDGDGAEPEPDAGSSPDAAPDAGGEPVDVAGSYMVTVTNGANQCGFGGFVEGAVATGVPLTVTQEEAAVSATVEGPVGTFLDLVLGSRQFDGELDGSAVSLTLFGTSPFMTGACTYTVNGEVSATVDGDLIEGSAEYRASTNGSPDCGVLETCVTSQQFNGTRPP